MTHKHANSSAVHALRLELKSLQAPLEGFIVQCDDNNIFKWNVAIFGPPDTIYQGGYFKAAINFPNDYPYSPPKFRFCSPIWHPNVYSNGELCISILHPPIDDPHSGEQISEKWNPMQNVRTVLLSVISLLNEPNTSSPANVDASVMYRKWRDGVDEEFAKIVKKQVDATKVEAIKDGVKVPETVDEYCVKAPEVKHVEEEADILEFDEDYGDYYSDEEFDDAEHKDEEEDSGQGE